MTTAMHNAMLHANDLTFAQVAGILRDVMDDAITKSHGSLASDSILDLIKVADGVNLARVMASKQEAETRREQAAQRLAQCIHECNHPDPRGHA